MKTQKTSAYYQKRADEEWEKMFEHAKEMERWATYFVKRSEVIDYHRQMAKLAGRRAVLYEITAKNLQPLDPTGFRARRVKLQFIPNPLPRNFDFDDDYIPLID